MSGTEGVVVVTPRADASLPVLLSALAAHTLLPAFLATVAGVGDLEQLVAAQHPQFRAACRAQPGSSLAPFQVPAVQTTLNFALIPGVGAAPVAAGPACRPLLPRGHPALAVPAAGAAAARPPGLLQLPLPGRQTSGVALHPQTDGWLGPPRAQVSLTSFTSKF